MGTIGTRAVLAAAFIAGSGLLMGMASLPPAEAATPGFVEASDAADSPGLLQRVRHRACLVSVAATRSDLRDAADRERECH